jgi:hypothetical protein
MESLEVMIKFIRVMIGTAAALALTGQAAAQTASCLAPAEVRALTTFAMPSVLDGLIANCGPQVGPGSFLMTRGSGLVSAYATRKQAAWPTARKAFFRLAESGKPSDKDTAEAVAKLPDAALQPFVEGMIGTMIGSKLKPGQCVIADKLLRLLAPLPPENTTELIGTIIELAEADKKPAPGGFRVCK